jgi:hypothetical protein
MLCPRCNRDHNGRTSEESVTSAVCEACADLPPDGPRANPKKARFAGKTKPAQELESDPT